MVAGILAVLFLRGLVGVVWLGEKGAGQKGFFFGVGGGHFLNFFVWFGAVYPCSVLPFDTPTFLFLLLYIVDRVAVFLLINFDIVAVILSLLVVSFDWFFQKMLLLFRAL